MPLLTTKPTDQLFERFMKHQPNFKATPHRKVSMIQPDMI